MVPLANFPSLRIFAMPKLPRAILFDMDDTILAVSGSARIVWKRIAEEFAASFAPLSPTDLVTAIEVQSELLWNDTAWTSQWRGRLREARRQVVASAFVGLSSAGKAVPVTEIGDTMADSFTLI